MVVGFLVFFTSKKTAVYRLYFFHIDLMAQKRVSAMKKGSKFDGCQRKLSVSLTVRIILSRLPWDFGTLLRMRVHGLH